MSRGPGLLLFVMFFMQTSPIADLLTGLNIWHCRTFARRVFTLKFNIGMVIALLLFIPSTPLIQYNPLSPSLSLPLFSHLFFSRPLFLSLQSFTCFFSLTSIHCAYEYIFLNFIYLHLVWKLARRLNFLWVAYMKQIIINNKMTILMSTSKFWSNRSHYNRFLSLQLKSCMPVQFE